MKHSPLIIILASVFIALIGFGIVIPLIPLYAERYGAGGLEVGMLLMTYSLMQFILAPWAGRLSDNIGRRPVLLIALAITTVSYILFGLAHDLTMLFVSRIMAGIGGADITVAQAYIADVTPPEKRARGMGLFGAAFGFGFVIGPTLAGILAPIHPELPAFFAAGFAGATTLFALFLLPEPEHKQQHVKKVLLPVREKLSGPVLSLTSLQFFAVLVQGLLQSMLVLFTSYKFGWQEQKNGYYFGVIGLVAVLVQGGLLGRLVKLFGQPTLVKAGLLLMGSGMVLLGLTQSVGMLLAGGIINAIGFACVLPTLSSLVSLACSERERGKTLGTFQSMGSLARIIAPVAGGILFDRLSPSAPFYAGGLVAFFTSLLAFYSIRGMAFKRVSHIDAELPVVEEDTLV